MVEGDSPEDKRAGSERCSGNMLCQMGRRKLLVFCILPSTPKGTEKYQGAGSIPTELYVVVMQVVSPLRSHGVFLLGHVARFFSFRPPFAVF